MDEKYHIIVHEYLPNFKIIPNIGTDLNYEWRMLLLEYQLVLHSFVCLTWQKKPYTKQDQ